MLFDLHIHSEYSFDSISKIDDILKIAKSKGLSGVAITDHDEFKGSLEACAKAKSYDLLVIPGMEISTEYGDIIGLFLQQEITSRMFLDVVGEIREQDGIVVLPHPFKRTGRMMDAVLNNIDLIEVFNARGESIGHNNCNRRAFDLALNLKMPMVAGSDAHFLFEIGNAGISLESVSSIDHVRERLLTCDDNKIVGHSSSMYVEVLSQMIKSYKTKDVKVWKSAFLRFARILKWQAYNR